MKRAKGSGVTPLTTTTTRVGAVHKVEQACLEYLRGEPHGDAGTVAGDIARGLVASQCLDPRLKNVVPAALERLVSSGKALKRSAARDGGAVEVGYLLNVDRPSPDPEVLMGYDTGIMTLASFVEGREIGNVWQCAARHLAALGASLRVLISQRDSGRGVLVRCHASPADIDRLEQLIPLVEQWRVNGGELTHEIQDRATTLLEAILSERFCEAQFG